MFSIQTSSTFIQHPPHPMHSGREYMHSAWSHFTGPFSMHIELHVWMPIASGLTPAFQASDAQTGDPSQTRRSSIQSTCHFCQWQDTQKWIPKRRCILTVAAAIHRQGEAYLQRAASISSTWEKGRQPETEQETTCPSRSLYSVLTLSKSIFGDSKCLLWQQEARVVKEKG